MAEILTRFGNRIDEILDALSQSYQFDFAPFDKKAAIEIGFAFYSNIQSGDKRGGSRRTWARVKFDRQIVSIAKTLNAKAIYSNDEEVRVYAERLGMKGIAVWDLDRPPPAQTDIDFLEPNDVEDADIETKDEGDVDKK